MVKKQGVSQSSCFSGKFAVNKTAQNSNFFFCWKTQKTGWLSTFWSYAYQASKNSLVCCYLTSTTCLGSAAVFSGLWWRILWILHLLVTHCVDAIGVPFAKVAHTNWHFTHDHNDTHLFLNIDQSASLPNHTIQILQAELVTFFFFSESPKMTLNDQEILINTVTINSQLQE